jgi:hypothetical protein
MSTQLGRVTFDGSQMLGHSSAVPSVPKAMVIVEIKYDILVVTTCGDVPFFYEARFVPLEDWKNDSDPVLRHARCSYSCHRLCVELTKIFPRHCEGRFVANLNPCHMSAIAISSCQDFQGPERLAETPLRPTPAVLLAAAGCLSTLTTGSCMQVQDNLQATLFGPLHSLIDVF